MTRWFLFLLMSPVMIAIAGCEASGELGEPAETEPVDVGLDVD